jgi:spermidine/putrescine transport system substrate-binding protein
MDYYYRPDVAAEVAAYVNYVCPVKGAKEEMMKIDPALAESEWIFPTDEILDKSFVFRPLTPEEQVQYTDAFGRVIQG